MEQKESIKWKLLLFLGLLTFQSFGMVSPKKETHKLLIEVNANWAALYNDIEHTFTPNNEKELVQLHLLNVVAYLESQTDSKRSKKQIKNRSKHIATLQKYTNAGSFPINNITSNRTPIFIDSFNVHCAVGYLLKESGRSKVAREIADQQLLGYLGDIHHPELSLWQKESGLSLFELALIQPTYGPPIPVCAAPSPIKWNEATSKESGITQLFTKKNNSFIYGIANIDALGLATEVKRFSPKTQYWSRIGTKINGEILDLTFCNDLIYLTVVLPEEKYPHQILQLKDNKWEKVTHFDGSIISMQALQGKLYVLGHFKKVNDSISSNLIVIDSNTITPYIPIGIKHTTFDHMQASESTLFLTGNGGIYKCKNDTLNYLTNIQYYQYMNNLSMDAQGDSLFIAAKGIQGFNTYYDKSEHATYMNNMLYGQDYPYSSANFTKSKKINGSMLIAGDFKTSTLIPQINDERHLIQCDDSTSMHWFGEGLLYQSGRNFYPILEKGIVLDFVQLYDHLYILKKDGSFSYASLALIEEKIAEVKERGKQ